MWSKYQIGNEEYDKKIIEQFEKRFSGVFQTDILDLVLLEKFY